MHLKLDCKCYIKMCSEKAVIGGEMKYDDHALALAAFFLYHLVENSYIESSL